MMAGADERLKSLLIPLVRAYVRYTPLAVDKRSFWSDVVNTHFAWRSHQFVARTIFGSKLAGNTTEILQQYVYYFGVWEPNLTRWIAGRLCRGDTFVDVGANVGYFSLLASTLVGETGRVVSIEASPRTFTALLDNLARNRAHNVRPVNIAVSDHLGVLKLFAGPPEHTGLTTTCEERGLRFECEIPTAPLGTILQPDEMRNARLVKVDVEGAEWRVARGLSDLLRVGRPDLEIAMEINPDLLARQGQDPEEILTAFAEAGFHAYSVPNDYSALSYLTPGNAQRPARLRVPIQGEADMIFSRHDAEHL